MIELIDNPKTSAASLAKMISTDQALTARILKLANSAYYGFSREIYTVNMAIVVMGFNSVKEIEVESKTIKQYLEEAILNQKQRKEIKPKRKKPLDIPKELYDIFIKDTKVKECFYSLSLPKQRDYCNYILEAKRETTKISRLEKIVPMILKRIGLNDKYK